MVFLENDVQPLIMMFLSYLLECLKEFIFSVWGSLNLTHTISTDAPGTLNKAYHSTGTYVSVSMPWKNKLDYRKAKQHHYRDWNCVFIKKYQNN